ncbi:MAG: cyclic nucleotide-binding domain-containing protein [Desulfobacterales bacterium]|nr:cyclic nucleotide-binding domain-containing protein [Desulfobacterales bacterium]
MLESKYLKHNMDIIQKLRQMPPLMNFDDHAISSLMSLSKLRKYKTGEMIIGEGSYDSWIYFLITGRVKIVKGEEVVATIKRSGDIFGEMSVITGSPRSASAYATEDTTCLATDVSYMDRLAGTDKLTVGYILYRLFSQILAERLRITTEALAKERKLDFID